MLTNLICIAAGIAIGHFFPGIWTWAVSKYDSLTKKV